MPDKYARPQRPRLKPHDPEMPNVAAYWRAMLPGLACLAVLAIMAVFAVLWAPPLP